MKYSTTTLNELLNCITQELKLPLRPRVGSFSVTKFSNHCNQPNVMVSYYEGISYGIGISLQEADKQENEDQVKNLVKGRFLHYMKDLRDVLNEDIKRLEEAE
jgi:hypothetical protein